ncbi:NAD(P)-dependent oxidoreductase [bacterium]|nr:NAD(P)-dependent oxidoreductase [bacterium]
MRVLITGAAGLAGHAVVDLLNSTRVHEFLGVDNLLYDDEYLRQVPFQAGNVGDSKFMVPLLESYKPDAVIHLAGIVGDAACAARPKEAEEANITSVKILRDHFEGRIIFPSSCSVYGANDSLVTEESMPNPLSLYAKMKLRAEEILGGKNVFIPRLGTLHGVTGRLRNDLVANVLTIRALIEGEITVFGGEQYRPLLHVRDFAETVVVQLPRQYTGIFNLVENNYKISELADIVKQVIPNTEIEITEMEFEDRRNYKASATKAKKSWGFDPRLTVFDTVEDIVRIYNEGRIKDFSLLKYSNMLTLDLGKRNK